MNYVDKHALVLGLGESGLAMARWLAHCGARVRVADTRDAHAVADRLAALHAMAPDSEFIGGPFSAGLLDGIDFVAVSPGLAPERDLGTLSGAAADRDIPLWGEMELFAQALAVLREERAYLPKVLAITGTNGKTTVTAMTGMLCRRAGLTTKVAGNISPAVLDVLREALIEDEVYVAKQRRAGQEAETLVAAQAAAHIVTAHAASLAVEDAAASPQMELAVQEAPPVDLHAQTAGSVEADQAFPDGLQQQAVQTASDVAVMSVEPVVSAHELAGQACGDGNQHSISDDGPLQPDLPAPVPDKVYEGILPQAWVLELSSFQLHATCSLQADAATVLNVTQDHLDWHGSMDAYAADKARIFGGNTVRVLNRDDPLVMQMGGAGVAVSSFGMDEPDAAGNFGLINDNGMLWLAGAIPVDDDEKPEGRRRKKNPADISVQPFMQKRLMPADALRVRGLHNALNALAALALCRAIDLPLAPLLHGLREYAGEPHRVELVTTIQGVEYYDDSKGTNVGATVAALNGLGHGNKPNRLLLIAGGDGKGQDFSPLAVPLSKYGRAVFLIGRDAAAIRNAITHAGIDLIDCATLEQAVEKAGAMAQDGDAVLLSPACASLDMFRNYAHRADVFVDAVRELALSRGEVMS